MKTLAELNTNPTTRTDHEGTTWARIYAVGGMGRSFSRNHKGAKFHLIHEDRCEAIDTTKQAELKAAFPRRNTPVVGRLYSPVASCNGNGITGIPVTGLDTEAINCQHCRGG